MEHSKERRKTGEYSVNIVDIRTVPEVLKGLCQDDFAILGQFFAKLITKCLFSYTICSYKTMRRIKNIFYQGELTIVTLLVIFEDSIKT